MGMKAKKCPQCSQFFVRRSHGCCPHCGTELVIPRRGSVITKREHGDKVRIFEHFLNEYMVPKKILFGDRGSSAYVYQLSMAGKLIKDACKYLNMNSRFDIDPTEFALQCIDFLFNDQGWANFAAKVDSMQMCNGRTFWAIAPKVLNEIEREEKQQASSERRLDAIDVEQFDVQFAI